MSAWVADSILSGESQLHLFTDSVALMTAQAGARNHKLNLKSHHIYVSGASPSSLSAILVSSAWWPKVSEWC